MKVSTKTNIFTKTTITLIFLVCFALELSAQSSRTTLTRVVIDAGHGGKDPGATYAKNYEKNITLKVALALGEMIEDNFKDVKVHYTRKTDVYIGLAERGDIANRLSADLFISIHVDANNNSSASGITSYVMGMDKNKINLQVAMRENDIIKMEDDYSTKYEGYIPGSTESFIIFNLMQYSYQGRSMEFAEMVQKHYSSAAKLPDRGVRMAPFLVLWRTAMPSALIELGFITNTKDRTFLLSSKGQQTAARSIFNAFSEYKAKVDGNSHAVFLDEGYADRTEVKPSAKTEAYYTVQLCSSPNRVDKKDYTFRKYRGKVDEIKVGSTYKYFYGKCDSYDEVLKLQKKVRSSVKGAFAVGVINGKVVSAAEVKKIIKK